MHHACFDTNRIHLSIKCTLKFALLSGIRSYQKSNFTAMKMMHPCFWCSILGQRGVSYTRVDTVVIQVKHTLSIDSTALQFESAITKPLVCARLVAGTGSHFAKRVPVQSHNSFLELAKMLKSHCVISQEPFFYSENPVF